MKNLLDAQSIEKIKIVDTNRKYKTPKVLHSKVNSLWTELKTKAKKEKFSVWNGMVYRLEEIKKVKDKTILKLGFLDFKTHYAVDKLTPLIDDKLDFSKRPNGLYIVGFIKTADSKYVFGKRSQKSLWRTDQIVPIGGVLNKDEMEIKTSKDLIKFLKKELKEELNIGQSVIKSIKFLGIYEAPTKRIGILFKVLLSKNSQQIKKSLKINFEHEKVFFLSFKNLIKTPPQRRTSAINYAISKKLIN